MTAADVAWDLSHLLGGHDERAVDDLLDQAARRAGALGAYRGKLASLEAGDFAGLMRELASVRELTQRAQSYAHLRFAADTADPANGALLQKVRERATALRTDLLFLELEWAALPDEDAERLLASEQLAFCRHHLRSARRYRPHLLSEPEERVLSEKRLTGASAWGRLFSELTSALEVRLDGATVGLEEALGALTSPDREARRRAGDAVTHALAPGLRTRAYVLNTLLHDKAVDDRLRGYPHWLAERNLANQASDESVEALVSAVRRRYDIPHRWYALKARLLGLDRLADHDRLAAVADEEERFGWDEARSIVLDAYASFSPALAAAAERFFEERWIDAAVRPGKRPGAFCSATVPSVHPYVFVNFAGRRQDVLTLAHELGHGLHNDLARPQGIFHQTTPLTVAETASVFGETLVLRRLLARAETPASRLALLAAQLDGAVATVFRQTAMSRFEHLVHTARRTEGELAVDRFGELWARSQAEMLGDAVEVTAGYRSWWSYIPHFVSTPGYVYAYAYGQLLALSVYRRYEEEGEAFVPRYIELLAAGGSLPPEDLGRIVGCDLTDAAFWDGGLGIVERQLEAATQAAAQAGRLR